MRPVEACRQILGGSSNCGALSAHDGRPQRPMRTERGPGGDPANHLGLRPTLQPFMSQGEFDPGHTHTHRQTAAVMEIGRTSSGASSSPFGMKRTLPSVWDPSPTFTLRPELRQRVVPRPWEAGHVGRQPPVSSRNFAPHLPHGPRKGLGPYLDILAPCMTLSAHEPRLEQAVAHPLGGALEVVVARIESVLLVPDILPTRCLLFHPDSAVRGAEYTHVESRSPAAPAPFLRISIS